MSDIINYPPNSHKSKAESTESTETTKRVEKVVTGKVITKKKSEARKLADIFIADDINNVKNYILMDVIVPAVKNTISNIVRDGIDMILFGSARRDSKRTNVSYVSYDKYSNREEPRTATVNRAVYQQKDIILSTRGDAEHVISQMEAAIETYGMVSVGDLYDMVGEHSEWTDQKYGWINVRNAEAIRVRDGYLLKLPKAMPLK